MVLSRDPMGRVLYSVIVGPVTSTIRGLSTEVELGEADRVPKASVVNLDNIQLLSRTRLVRRLGKASPATMRRICTSVAIAIDCLD